MNIKEFFQLKQRDRNKYMRGCLNNEFNNCPTTTELFYKTFKLNSSDDCVIESIHTNNLGCRTIIGLEYFVSLNIKTNHGWVPFNIRFKIKNQKQLSLSSFEPDLYLHVYSKQCNLFDNRNEYNNIEICFRSDFLNSIINCTNFIDVFINFINEYFPFFKELENICVNNNGTEFINCYNRYFSVPFIVGQETWKVAFVQMLANIKYNIAKYCQYNISIDECFKIFSLMTALASLKDRNYSLGIFTSVFINTGKIFDFNKYNLWNINSVAFNTQLFTASQKIINAINNYFVIKSAKTPQKTFGVVHAQMNKEYYTELIKLRNRISEKFGISTKYLDSLSYLENLFGDNGKLTHINKNYWSGPVPDEYANTIFK